MISLSEYNQQKQNLEQFERTASLAIARMMGISDDCNLLNATIHTVEDRLITLDMPNKGASVLWSDLRRFMKKGKWVVEFKDIYCNREYRIFDTKKEANKEYKELIARTAEANEDGEYDIEWVEEPTMFSWEELAELDPTERCWC
jgi:hypothetical protein